MLIEERHQIALGLVLVPGLVLSRLVPQKAWALTHFIKQLPLFALANGRHFYFGGNNKRIESDKVSFRVHRIFK